MSDEVESGSPDDAGDKLIPEWNRSGDDQVVWLGIAVLVVLALVFFGVSRLGDTADDVTDAIGLSGGDDLPTLADAIRDDRELTVSAGLLEGSDLETDLEQAGGGPYTVFVIVDDEWDQLAASVGVDIDELVAEAKEELAALDQPPLLVIDGEVRLDDLEDGPVVSLDGSTVEVDDEGLINGLLEVEDGDIETGNGLLHKLTVVDG